MELLLFAAQASGATYRFTRSIRSRAVRLFQVVDLLQPTAPRLIRIRRIIADLLSIFRRAFNADDEALVLIPEARFVRRTDGHHILNVQLLLRVKGGIGHQTQVKAVIEDELRRLAESQGNVAQLDVALKKQDAFNNVRPGFGQELKPCALQRRDTWGKFDIVETGWGGRVWRRRHRIDELYQRVGTQLFDTRVQRGLAGSDAQEARRSTTGRPKEKTQVGDRSGLSMHQRNTDGEQQNTRQRDSEEPTDEQVSR